MAVAEVPEGEVVDGVLGKQGVGEGEKLGEAIPGHDGVRHQRERSAAVHDFERIGRHRMARLEEERAVAVVVQQQDRVRIDAQPAQALEPRLRKRVRLGGRGRHLQVRRHGVVAAEEAALVVHVPAAVDAEVLAGGEARQRAAQFVLQPEPEVDRRRFGGQREEQVEERLRLRRQPQGRRDDRAVDAFGADDEIHEIHRAVHGGEGAAGVLDVRSRKPRNGNFAHRAIHLQAEDAVLRNARAAARGDERSARQHDLDAFDPVARGAGGAGREAGGVAGDRAADGGLGAAGRIDGVREASFGRREHRLAHVFEEHAHRRHDGSRRLVNGERRLLHRRERDEDAAFRRRAAGQVRTTRADRHGHAAAEADAQDDGDIAPRARTADAHGAAGQVRLVGGEADDDVGIRGEVEAKSLGEKARERLGGGDRAASLGKILDQEVLRPRKEILSMQDVRRMR